MPEDTQVTEANEPSVADIVKAAVAEAVQSLKAENTAKADDLRGKIAAGAWTGTVTDSVRGGMKEWDDALGITRDYGDLHYCFDETCRNRAHGLRFARFVHDLAAQAKGYVTKTPSGGLLDTTNSAGGYLVPEIYNQDLIPLLRAKAVVRAIGTPVFPMTERIHHFPRQSGAGVAYWLSEAAQVTASNQTFQQVTLTAKDLLALTFFSNDLLMDSRPAVDQVVRQDLVKQLALAEDKAFLIGGTAVATGAPQGIYQYNAANTYAVTSGVTEVSLSGKSPSYDDFQSALYNLENANVPMDNVAWVCHPREMKSIRQVKDAQGNPLFRDNFTIGQNAVMDRAPGGPLKGELLGFPLYVTTQMPQDDSKGTGNTGGAIILGDWSEALIGDRMQPAVAVTSEATILDPDGSTNVNLFSTNQSAVRLVQRLDFQLRHPAGFCVISGCI